MTRSGGRLHLLLLHDGRKGHISQSNGLATAISNVYRCSYEEIEAVPRWPLAMKLLRLVARRAPRLVAASYRFRKPRQAPDLILSYGGKIAPLNVALASLYGARNINIGSLRNLSPANFSAVISPAGLPGTANSIASGRPLTQVNAKALQQAGGQYPSRYPLWLLLMGGKGAGFAYKDAELQQLGEQLNRLAILHDIRWLISTSPRTGQAAERRLGASIHASLLTDAIWYSETPDRALMPMLAGAARVFCSADSMTMINESLDSGKPVTAYFGKQQPTSGKFAAEFQHLVNQAKRGGLVLSPIDKLHEVPLPGAGEITDPAEGVIRQLQQLGVLPNPPPNG